MRPLSPWHLAVALNPMPLMDELIEAVGRTASISAEQASAAVSSMLRFLAARLPSPLFGELQARLNAPPSAGTADSGREPTRGP